ncbi:MAG: hypothetical protein CI947_2415, partial [Halanaerobium sp.]
LVYIARIIASIGGIIDKKPTVSPLIIKTSLVLLI